MTVSHVSLVSENARLRDATSRLRTAWEIAGHTWSDAQHRRLDQRFLQPLEQAVRTAGAAIGTMDEILQQVQRDCGDYPIS